MLICLPSEFQLNEKNYILERLYSSECLCNVSSEFKGENDMAVPFIIDRYNKDRDRAELDHKLTAKFFFFPFCKKSFFLWLKNYFFVFFNQSTKRENKLGNGFLKTPSFYSSCFIV